MGIAKQKEIRRGVLLGVMALALVAAGGDATLKNGSFETPGVIPEKHLELLRKKGFDVGPGDMAPAWAANWLINPATGAGRAEVVEAEDAPDGKRCLMGEAEKYLHVYAGQLLPAAEHTWRLSARGEPIIVDGKEIAPTLTVSAYFYGPKGEAKMAFLKTLTFEKNALTDEWKEYEGRIGEIHPGSKNMRFVLDMTGRVMIDDVSVEPAP